MKYNPNKSYGYPVQRQALSEFEKDNADYIDEYFDPQFNESKSFENKDGFFIGFENYQSYFANPALVYSIYNSLFISIITMFITISLAFINFAIIADLIKP